MNFQPSAESVARAQEMDFLIDHGPLLDRLGGSVAMAILASQHPTALAVKENFKNRKWLDLRRPDLRQAFELLLPLNLHPDLTQERINQALTPPAQPHENSATRILFFS